MPVTAFAPTATSRPTLVPAPALGAQSAYLRRAESFGVVPTGMLHVGPVTLDVSRYEVTVDGHVVDLSPRQVELLAIFLAAPARVWSRDQLHAICWGDTAASRRVDVQLCRIRGKLGLDLFRNVRGRGWTLASSEQGWVPVSARGPATVVDQRVMSPAATRRGCTPSSTGATRR